MSRASSRTGRSSASGDVVIGHPQVGGNDLRVFADLGRQSVGDLAAELEDDDAIGDAHDESHVVFDEQDRVAVVVGNREGAKQSRARFEEGVAQVLEAYLDSVA